MKLEFCEKLLLASQLLIGNSPSKHLLDCIMKGKFTQDSVKVVTSCFMHKF